MAKAQKEFDNLNKAYHSDKLSAKKYQDSAFNLANQYLSEGTHFKTQELTDLLSLYKEIASKKKPNSGLQILGSIISYLLENNL